MVKRLNTPTHAHRAVVAAEVAEVVADIDPLDLLARVTPTETAAIVAAVPHIRDHLLPMDEIVTLETVEVTIRVDTEIPMETARADSRGVSKGTEPHVVVTANQRFTTMLLGS